ncbi:MAG: putative DNA binding domain-containing protein [Erysipelotrichaceae bacterium]|nr:putative DNA binding domain-containing protein [Solobacterium sp.]MDY2953425.1 putative DNA binding domain-containing protein [Erysipelotrichaceae bacterium]MCI7445340.1 putative DNA binding domain-containing protein [Solobacterium sp.]MDD7776245.1 putative DNA binding domain-containing protein [Solobacterium sp.]MDY5276384.1 putative DNA binding domain-containing protein [Erysipelotrichaceae bacterium]
MKFKESETVELKLIVTDVIKKEIVAFANSEGGTIYIGVSDDGEVVGIEDSDKSGLQVSNMVHDNIKPDLSMFVSYRTLNFDGKEVLSIDVERGTNRPYYLANKGLRPEGVYIRHGFSSIPASDSTIRNMIKETDGDVYEALRSINQDLTFNSCENEFKNRNIDFKEQALKLVSNDGLYTNLGLLLSDQCPYTIKAAVFEDYDQSLFKDRNEFSGSLLKQLEDVYSFIDKYNNNRSTFDKLWRIDTRDYPEKALREALLNSIVHRDYSYSASTLISIYKDRLEIVSVGGLMPGYELKDIKNGLSDTRNPNLANIFYRLKLIEAYGTGIKKIYDAYELSGCEPEIITTNNSFKIILPNLNYKQNNNLYISSPEMIYCDENILLKYLNDNQSITRKEVETLMGLSQSSAGRILKKMVDEGKLIQFGGSRNIKYILRK